MKTKLMLAALLCLTGVTFAKPPATEFPDVSPTMKVEEKRLSKNPEDERGTYFVITRANADAKAKPAGILVILPGGPGSRDFLPFCANGIAQNAAPEDFISIQLVAPIWQPEIPEAKRNVIWSSEIFPVPGAKFSTEEFIDKAVAEVRKSLGIDPKHIVTLGWSSSGHVVYSASTRCKEVTGSIPAMSRFLPDTYIQTGKVRGKPFFLYHSPEDKVCPYADVAISEKFLTKHKAIVKTQDYPGGHGWTAGTDHMANLRAAIEWLRTASAGEKK